MKRAVAAVLLAAVLAPGGAGEETVVVLENGLTAIVVPAPEASTAVVAASHAAGVRHEPPGKAGLAHLTEHLVVRAATASYAAREAERRLLITGPTGRTGLDANAETLHDFLYTYAIVKPDALDLALDVEAERLASCRFDAGILEAERERALDEVRFVEKNPAAAAYSKLLALAYGDHPYGRPKAGRADELRSVSLEDVRAFYDAHVADPRRTVLYVSGPFAAEDVLARIRSRFEEIVPRGGVPRDALPPPPEPAGLARAEVRTGERGLRIAYVSPDPAAVSDKAAMLVLSWLVRLRLETEVLGTGKASSAYAFDDPFAGGPGLFLVEARCEVGASLSDLESAILGTVEWFSDRPIDPATFRLAQRTSIAAVDGFASPRSIEGADELGRAQAAIDRLRFEVSLRSRSEALRAALRDLDPDSTRTVATRYLVRSRANVVTSVE